MITMDLINDPQKMLEQDNISDDANNTTTGHINTSIMEFSQTNVVKYHNKLESVAVDIRDIEKMRAVCEKMKRSSFPIAEICLSAASLFAGGFISALISGVSFELNLKSIVFYTLCPAIAAGCIVAYFFKRDAEQTSTKFLADRILEYLPENENGNDGGNAV